MASKGGVIVVVSGEDKTGAVFSAVKKHLDETRAAAKETSESMGSVGQMLMQGLQTAGIYIGLREIIGGFKELIGSAMEAAVQIGHLTEQTGISVQNLSVLKYAAQETGIDFEVLTRGFKKLAVTTYDADSGNKTAARGFNQLGISVEQLRGKGDDMYGVLTLLADKFHAMPDGIAKSDTAAKIFGARMGATMIPVLNELGGQLESLKAQAQALGVVWDESGIKKMQELHRQTEIMKGSFQGLKMEIASDLAPTMTKFFDWMAQGIHRNTEEAKHLGESWKAVFETIYQAQLGNYGAAWLASKNIMPANSEIPGATAPGPSGTFRQDAPDDGGEEKGSKVLLADRIALAELKAGHNLTVAEEIEFWQKRINALDHGSAQYLEVLNEINRLVAKLGPTAPGFNALTGNLSKLGDKAGAVARQVEDLKDAEGQAVEDWDKMATGMPDLGKLFPKEKMPSVALAEDYSKLEGAAEKYAHGIFDPLFDMSMKWDAKWKAITTNLLRDLGQTGESMLFGALFGDPQGRGGKGWDGSSFEGNTQKPGRSGIAGATGLVGELLSGFGKKKSKTTSNGGLGSGAGTIASAAASVMQMGKGAAAGAGAIQVVINNTGTAQEVTKTQMSGGADLESMVLSIFTKDLGTNGPMASGILGLVGL